MVGVAGGDVCGAGATMQSATAGKPGRDGLAGNACGSERGAVSGPEDAQGIDRSQSVEEQVEEGNL